MKRSIIVLVCMVFIGINGVVLSEAIDIDKLSHDDLVSLHRDVGLKLYGEALLKGVEMPEGEYEGGVDLPIGSYVITVSGKNIFCILDLYENSKKETRIFSNSPASENDIPFSVKVTVREGQYLSIKRYVHREGTITIQAFSSIFGF